MALARLLAAVACLLSVSDSVAGAGGVMTNASEALVMHTLATSTGAGRALNWAAGSDPCGDDWYGVRCDNNGGTIASIHVEGVILHGTLPGELPLSALVQLGFVGTRLTGRLPRMRLPLLKKLNLDGNLFTEMPPGFFHGLSALRHFTASNNPRLRDWELPSDLRRLTNLTSFNVDNAGINGSVVPFLGDGNDDAFPILDTVSLSGNKLHGSLPDKFARNLLRGLEYLDLSRNYLSGPINSIDSLQSIKELHIDANQFTGPLPGFSNLQALKVLSVTHNRLSGVVPGALTKHTLLTSVSLTGNLLQGPLPEFAGTVQNDVVAAAIYGSFCRLSHGPCDPRVDALLSVAAGFNYPEVLAVSWKRNDPCAQWVGVHCNETASGSTITGLNLCRMGLNGTLDCAIGSLKSITAILLSGNNISGVIPPSLAEMPSLRLLDIANNSFEGNLPNFRGDVEIWTDGDSNLNATRVSSSSVKVKPFRAGVAVAIFAAVAGVL